ncbi:hypothetical protein OQA88_7150 [Cercophora sp. LCS_1]
MNRSAKLGNSPFGGFNGSSAGAGAFGASRTATLSYITPPPDLSKIPQDIVVPFKNLLKKDSITKAKALDDIIAYVKGYNGNLEEQVLEAWAQLYARTSIDNSRRVRELSHILLFELLKSARKRMEKRVPFMVGAWLAGTFDSDKVVSRAATDALSSLLDTKEKQNKFWVKCRTQILEFATDAVRETPDSLSDARSSTKEDSVAKYYRVMGASLSLLLGLLKRVKIEDMETQLAEYLAVDAVWSMTAAEEAHVRRALYQFTYTLLAQKPEALRPRLSHIGRILIADSLKSSQSGSATDLVRVLTKLTQAFPQVWGTKTHPLQRLRVFVERGSQGGSGDYWQALDQLLAILPGAEVPLETAAGFLKATRAGISNRQEARTNAPQAWEAYLNAFDRFMASLKPDVAFVEENLYPLVRQYLRPSPDTHVWTAPTATATSPKPWIIVSSNLDLAIRESAAEEWARLGETLSSTLSSSLPEVSKDYQKSQQTVAAEGERWFTLASAIVKGVSGGAGNDAALQDAIAKASSKILHGAQDLLSRRNYKPFGAASVLQAAFSKCPELCGGDEFIGSLFPTANNEQLRLLVTSPSFPFLVRCLDETSVLPQEQSQKIWLSLVASAIQSDRGHAVAALNLLLPVSTAASVIRRHDELQSFLASNWLACAQGDGSPPDWELCESSLAPGIMPDDRLAGVLADIICQLGVSSQAGPTLRALELVTESRPSLASQHEGSHVDLVTKLLGLTELADQSIAGKAASLQATLDHKSQGRRPLVTIIQKNLEDAKSSSLGINILIQKARSTLALGDVALGDLFPSSNAWLRELKPFLMEAPNPSLSLTNSVGGAYFLVKEGLDVPETSPGRDAKGRSIPARMAIYTASLLSSGVSLSTLPEEVQRQLLYLVCFTAELAADQLTLGAEGGVWDPLTDDALAELEEFTTLSRKILNGVVSDASDWRDKGFSGTSLAVQLVELTLQHSKGLTTISLYSAKVLGSLLQALVETHGPPSLLEEWFKKKAVLKATPDTLMGAVGCLVGFGEILASSDAVKMLCNRLVSEIIGALPGLEKTLHFTVLFNIAAGVYESGQLPVDNRKQTLALRQFTSWTDSPDEVSPQLAAEACKGIQRVLPTVKDIYGPYWQQTVDYCLFLWQKARTDVPANRLPYVHASLKLIWALIDTAEDASDDLMDVLKEKAIDTSEALIDLLKCPVVLTQPGQIVDALLSRIIEKGAAEASKLEDLYGLVASPSRDIQKAAFGILHQALPKASEKLSVDALLGDRDAALPAELLSLLLDAPTLEAYPEEILIQFPTPVRAYLLAWHLILDAYSKSSFKLRTDYSESLKKQDFVQPFFRFMFDVLGHSVNNPLNLDREGFTESYVRSYDIKLADAEAEERSMHWLLIHLFFSTLKYIPGLFRSWYLESSDKQTKNCLPGWITKYFSPYIVAGVLDEVVDWAGKQEVTDDEKELVVKVSRPAREVTAAYEVDDEWASVLFKIPPAYPLETVEVIGIKRVAVDEKKWESWLLSTRGAIQFGASIIDGLSIFRQNLTRTLKGQTECAICYSIVSSDKKLPDKECNTCHHSFHRICLFKWFQNSGRNSCPLCRNPIELMAGDSRPQRR